MNKILITLITVLSLGSCKKDQIAANKHLLRNCQPGYLLFSDNIQSILNPSFVYTSDTNLFRYSYLNDKIIRVDGGFIGVPSGTNFSRQVFSEMAYDSIMYSGPNIYVFQKFNAGDSIIEKKNSPTVFTLDSKNMLQKITKRDVYHPKGYDLFYLYADNQITETDVNGTVRRKFYFENGNLTSVVSELIDNQGVVISKAEILFQNYDSNRNPFRSLYFIEGAFYRAFSKNNYSGYTINQYGFLYDGSFGITGTYTYSLPIQYDGENYPEFGDYE